VRQKAEKEARNKRGKAKVKSSGGASRVKRKEGVKESEVGRVAVFIRRSGQPMHARLHAILAAKT
jgi:hypothetical protein